MTKNSKPEHTNKLILETSPYLLQHAHNPVDWYPWGEEALERAKKEDRPILLSIGYSACHWCHVMERESFENEEIARLMNENFVCIKVDREERPDLDEIYMSATLAINRGQGGWPMTVFLTPDQEPFFAGTYFPPVDHYGRPGFSSVLTKIKELWGEDRAKLMKEGKELVGHLQRQSTVIPALLIGEKEIGEAASQLLLEFDSAHGGFGRAPKFPPSTALSLLLRVYRRSGDESLLKVVRVTLDAMARGGLYDQMGGGFSRYSTDNRWLVPHFEKMLYDNALLTRIYLEAFQVTGEPFYEQVARETLEYVLREMRGPEGGFYSSTDADSEGEEGKFFVWTPAEIRSILDGKEAVNFCAYYDITEGGNWEGKNIPNTPRTLEQVGDQLGIGPDALWMSLESARRKVYDARKKRVHPGLDDKILTAWNGLMIGAMAEGGRVLNDPRYRKAAERAADFILKRLKTDDGRLLRTYRCGKAHIQGLLEDHAYLCEGLVDLYESGGAAHYLMEAGRLAGRVIEKFSVEGGGFYSTSRDHERLITRHREGYDGATPSANAAAAYALARISFHLNRDDLRQAATAAVAAYGKTIERMPRAFCKLLSVADFLLEGPIEIALIGQPGDPRLESFRREMNRRYLPNRTLAHLDPSKASMDEPEREVLPLLAGKEGKDGKPTLYICQNFTCKKPLTNPAELGPALEAQENELKAGRRTAL